MCTTTDTSKRVMGSALSGPFLSTGLWLLFDFPTFSKKKCQAHSQLQIFASWFSVSDYQPLWWWWCLSVMSDSLWPHGLLPARLFCPCNPPCKNIRVGCHLFLQGTFPTQGLNLSLCIQADSLPFKPLGKPHQLFSSPTKSRGKIFKPYLLPSAY